MRSNANNSIAVARKALCVKGGVLFTRGGDDEVAVEGKSCYGYSDHHVLWG